jgi:hypothetical protein
MQHLTEKGQRLVGDLANRHGVSEGAVESLLAALIAGHGTQAQFDHRELGGMGQWSRGGMVMVGDMFNDPLKRKVDALCGELSDAIREGGVVAAAAERASWSASASGAIWPSELGAPASVGSQNGARYAVFPHVRRLAVERDGQVTIYDTADHQISGVSQQQSHEHSVTFTSQHGPVGIGDLKIVSSAGSPPRLTPATRDKPIQSAATHPSDDIFAKIERLHELFAKGVLTEEEFVAKKAELLSRI